MAHLRKVKNSWQIQFYLDRKLRWIHLPPYITESEAKDEKEWIEGKIKRHKQGKETFNFENYKSKSIQPKIPKSETLREVLNGSLEERENDKDISDITIKRNIHACKVFIDVIGGEIPILELKDAHFSKFKEIRYEIALEKHKKKNSDIDIDKIKRGVNKDLVNLRAVLRYAIAKEIISPEFILPKIRFYKVDRNRLPKYLTDQEIIAIANNLTGEAKLAFWIIRYTGARRAEIARRSIHDNFGLKWQDIDWIRNIIRLYSKGQERLIPLHPILRNILLDRKSELGENWAPEDFIVHFIRDTLSTYFKRAMREAGIDKSGAVHILRHSAATELLASSKDLRLTQEFLGHKSITTTEIYTHIIQERMEDEINKAFS